MGGPTYYEFFAGGGMARAGLGLGWRCLFANDFDPRKARAYADNWGAGDFRLEDIHKLTADDLPGRADLAWASFPCQDLSLAGAGRGLDGARSGAFFGLAALIAGLRAQGRAPKLLALENVVGLLTSNGGADFVALCRALRQLGYRFGALTIDAAHFVPQSRPRLFVIAVDRDVAIAPACLAAAPSPDWASSALRRAAGNLPPELAADWLWWRLPPPPARNVALAQVIEARPRDVEWLDAAKVARLLDLMAPLHRARVEAAKASRERMVGALYRRMRCDADGARVQRAEVRFDGLAGCLRTPAGGSSRQSLLIVENGRIRARLLSGREAARLMGLPEDYKLPKGYTEACHLLGDGVVAPAVRFLAEHLLELLAGIPAAPLLAAE
ncbi:MAG: DNA cytosine methyltransferase [Methylobacteriaceae bacterium]|nr:DNA cytosine methyltransferase [Methylobacteriaceae bacterium]